MISYDIYHEVHAASMKSGSQILEVTGGAVV